MTQSKHIAITGGIGSGKSALCNMLREMGYAVFSCDAISHELWEEESYRRALSARFPACCRGGEFDRDALKALVFSDRAAMERLEQFSHPLIMAQLERRMGEHAVAFAEVPLLFEGGYEGLFDGIIALRRTMQARIEAVVARDGLTADEVRARMARQIDPSALSNLPCFLIENNGDLAGLREKAKKALRYFSVE